MLVTPDSAGRFAQVSADKVYGSLGSELGSEQRSSESALFARDDYTLPQFSVSVELDALPNNTSKKQPKYMVVPATLLVSVFTLFSV